MAWGQAGIWYIANSSSGNAPADEYTYNNETPETNYYLVPAADPQVTTKRDAYYSGDSYATPGDPAKPFITTYKSNMDNNSIWLIESSGDGYYYIIHAATGKYLIYEPPHSGATNRKSMHLQTVDNGTYNPSTNNNFKFKFETSGNGYTIRRYNVTSGNRFFNVANRNFNTYYGRKATSNNYDHDGIVGLYTSGHVWILKDASNADFVKPVISDVNESTSSVTISFPTVSITYPYTTPLTEDIKALGITSIIYTTNGDEPTVGGATTRTYSSAIYLDEPCTVKARGVYGNSSMTPVVSKSFDNINKVCALPTFTYNHTDKTVTITSIGPTDATFYYTLNGIDPTTTVSETNFQYNDTPINITDNCNIVKAIAVREGYAPSIVSSISRVESPTFVPNSQGITISCATEGASIYYTTDGSEPNTNSILYTEAFNVSSGTKIKAIAVKDGYIYSSIVSFTSLSPIEISYDVANNKVVISNAPVGATIYYTTGTTESDTPDPSGSEKIEYTYGNTGFDLPDNVDFIKAIAIKGSDMTSEVQLAIVVHASTAETQRPYLIQSVECTDFYMIPGDKSSNVVYINTSSLARAAMEWCFYVAGKDNGVDYYYIKNNATNEYVCYSSSVRLHTAATFEAAADKNIYKFSIHYANTTNPGYYIHPKGSDTAENGLFKKKGNNEADVIELADATTAENKSARWNFIRSANKPEATLPFVPWGEGGEYKYYKIKKDANNFIIPGSEIIPYATASVVSDIENGELWYFDEAYSDGWVTYYYIVNAATGEYLYFNGATKSDNNFAFAMKKELGTDDSERYQFAFAKTTTNGQYYILPRALQSLKNNNYSLLNWDGSNPLSTLAQREKAAGKWTFEASDVPIICLPPMVSLGTDGNVILVSRTRGSAISYKLGDSEDYTAFDNNSPIITSLTEGTQIEVATKTTIGGTPEVDKTVTVVYKPTIVLESVVYNGQKQSPIISSIKIGDTVLDINDHCMASSDDVDVNPSANAVITQKENEEDYLIYGTAQFTIEKSPLTIYADGKTVEYGDAIPELSFSTSGLATIDEVVVNLTCTPGTEMGIYPITFSNLTNSDVKYTIKRHDGSDASGNYKDISLVASSLVITSKSLGDGMKIAEGITAEVTQSGEDYDIVVKSGGSTTLVKDVDYDFEKEIKGYYDDIVWTISGKGHYSGSAIIAFVKSEYTQKNGEWLSGYVASSDWAIPDGSGIEVWIATSVNPSVNVVQVMSVDYLPADVPVVITATEDKSGGFIVYPKSNETADLTASQKNGNKFQVVDAENGKTVTDAEKYVYSKGEFVLAFGGILPQGMIYIDRPASVSGARLRIGKSDNATGISDISEDNDIRIVDDIWYSLDGRKLSRRPNQKGMYINNGRKIVVK